LVFAGGGRRRRRRGVAAAGQVRVPLRAGGEHPVEGVGEGAHDPGTHHPVAHVGRLQRRPPHPVHQGKVIGGGLSDRLCPGRALRRPQSLDELPRVD
jgi:hypothetical protein